MKLVIVAVCLLGAVAMAAPSTLPAIEFKYEDKPNGGYHLCYITEDGTIVNEDGHLIPTADGKDFVMVVTGSSTYKGTDGKTYITKYSSGLDGFQATGDHLPKAPEVPAA